MRSAFKPRCNWHHLLRARGLSTQPAWIVMGFSPSGDCRATIPGSPAAKASQPAWFTPSAPGHNCAHSSSGRHTRQQCRNQQPSCLVHRQLSAERNARPPLPPSPAVQVQRPDPHHHLTAHKATQHGSPAF